MQHLRPFDRPSSIVIPAKAGIQLVMSGHATPISIRFQPGFVLPKISAGMTESNGEFQEVVLKRFVGVERSAFTAQVDI